MRMGFISLCNHITTCLGNGTISTEDNVREKLHNASEWSACRNFLQCVGTVASVATMIFQKTMGSDDLTGDPLLLGGP
jgi:hypothetical protein